VTVSKTGAAQGADVAHGSAEPRSDRGPDPLEEFLRKLQIGNAPATTSRPGRPLRRFAHHTTHREHLPSILSHGLVPMCPLDNPEWEGWEELPGSPYAVKAVYLFGNALDAMLWAWRVNRDTILTFDVEGLMAEPLGLLPEAGSSAFRVYERIAPERLIQARRSVHAGDWRVFDHRAHLGTPVQLPAGASGNVVDIDNVEDVGSYRGRPT
jgi:hypothetical protein